MYFQLIRLLVDFIALENSVDCVNDALTIQDAGLPLACAQSQCTHFCGSLAEYTWLSTSNTVVIALVTNSDITDVGFSVRYESVVPPEVEVCPDVFLSANPGVITSPNYPDHYDNSLECMWYIEAPEGQASQHD